MSLLLCLWMAAANTGATSGGVPASPQAPAVTAPEAPTPSAPPVPALPEGPPANRAPALARHPAKRVSAADAPAADAEGQGAGVAVPSAIGRDPSRAEVPRRSSSGKSKKGQATPAGRGVPPNLPSLTTTALRNELRQSLAEPGEPGAPVSERARLEQLAGEIAKAREALKQETARLEALIKQRGSCESEARASADENNPAAAAAALAAKDMAREQLDSVSKTMKGMKPEQAAAVVTRLDHHLAAEVLRRMRPADAGAVLGYLKPELAAELATEIATRKPSFPKKGSTP
jgi:flagellar motility protein MotE (MotC chaperone)